MTLGAHVSLLVWVAGAMLTSYRHASRDFFRSRQKTILLLGSMLMPLASIPEALLSPLLVLGDPQIGSLGRCFALVIDLFMWSAWLSSQQHFIPSIREVGVVNGVMRSPMIALCAVLRYCMFSWPAFLLFLALQWLRDESGRARFAQMALCVVVIASGAVSEWCGRRAARRHPARHANESAVHLLFRYALSGIAAWTDPRVPFMHASSFAAVILTYLVVSRLPSPYGVVTTSLIGSLIALLPLRALLDFASQRTVADCPMLVACPRFRTVENFRTICSAATLFAASLTASALGQGRGDALRDGVLMTATFMSLLFLAFVFCRIARVHRGVETGVLCAVGFAAILLECI